MVTLCTSFSIKKALLDYAAACHHGLKPCSSVINCCAGISQRLSEALSKLCITWQGTTMQQNAGNEAKSTVLMLAKILLEAGIVAV
jgi:predicted transcriptional regulator